jgi:aminoglycoside phosphotransferase
MSTAPCPSREMREPEALLAAEREMASWIAAQKGAPDVEVHTDSDAAWMVHPGSAWANCVAHVRVSEATA